MSKKWKKLEGLDALKQAFGGEGDGAQPQSSGKPKSSKKDLPLDSARGARKDGMVYSTDPNYSSAKNSPLDSARGSGTDDTLPTREQDLRVQLEKKNRGGKAVTLITGFIGSDDDLKSLGKMLKTKCGVGGSAKDGEIIVQGDHREKVMEILEKEGYRAKRFN